MPWFSVYLTGFSTTLNFLSDKSDYLTFSSRVILEATIMIILRLLCTHFCLIHFWLVNFSSWFFLFYIWEFFLGGGVGCSGHTMLHLQFQLYNIMISQVYTLCCAHHKCSCHTLLLQYHCLYSSCCVFCSHDIHSIAGSLYLSLTFIHFVHPPNPSPITMNLYSVFISLILLFVYLFNFLYYTYE